MEDSTSKRIGRRGAILLSYGSLWMLLGLSILSIAKPGIDPLSEHMPYQARAGAWILTGLFACAFAFRKRHSDSFGFLALYIMPTAMAVSYAASSVLAMLDMGGNPNHFYNGLIFLGFCVPIIVVAGWPEPMRKADLS